MDSMKFKITNINRTQKKMRKEKVYVKSPIALDEAVISRSNERQVE